jgi:hypothetical protein
VDLFGSFIVERTRSAHDGRPDVGGLSGGWYDRQTRRIWTVSDDVQRPRLVALELRLMPAVRLIVRDVVRLEANSGTLNAEGLAPSRQGFFVSSEGEPAGTSVAKSGIFEFTRDGHFVRELPLPSWYVADEDRQGLRRNAGLEGLSVSPDGSQLVAAVEHSLLQDGVPADFDRGGISRP